VLSEMLEDDLLLPPAVYIGIGKRKHALSRGVLITVSIRRSARSSAVGQLVGRVVSETVW
jgi:hypothetical protein